MDSFVEAQNSLKRKSDGGCVTLLQSHAVRFVHTCGHEVAGLKTYRGPKRKDGDAPVERRRPAERLSIFQYWFARCAVELWVRFREPCRARRCIVAGLVRVDLFQRGYRGNYDHHGKCNRK